MAAVCQYALSYNVTGAISAQYPVAFTTGATFVTALLVMWFYAFLYTTFSRLVLTLENHYTKSSNLYWVDVLLFGGLIGWGCLFIAMFVWAIVEYYQCYTVVPTGYKLNYTIPQEYMYLVMFGLSWSIFAGDKAIMLYTVSRPALRVIQDGGEVEDALNGKVGINSADQVIDNWWMTYARPVVFGAMVLFLGAYTMVLKTATPFIDYCGGGACWPTSTFYPVAEFTLVAGVLLTYGLFQPMINAYMYPPLRDAKGNIIGQGETWPMSRGRSSLFSAAEAPELALPYVLGWVPTYPLNRLWIIAYGFYIPTATSQITHDYVKGIILLILWWLLPVMLTLLAQDADYFFPYHIACVMVSIFIFWFNTGIVNRVQGTSLVNNQIVKNWGLMMTGPDSNANITADATWIDFMAVMSMAAAVVVFINQRGYFQISGTRVKEAQA